MQKVLEDMKQGSSEKLLEIPATYVNRCALSLRGDLGVARLTFGEENTQDDPTHYRVAIAMPIQTLVALHHLLDSCLMQMEAARLAYEQGIPTTKN